MKLMKPEEVKNVRKLAEYMQQEVGSPMVYASEYARMGSWVKSFFQVNPGATWGTLTATVDWCRRNKKRPSGIYALVTLVPRAFQAGVLSEFTPQPTKEIDEKIEIALTTESDPSWRRRLLTAESVDGKTRCYEEWLTAHV